MRPDPDGRLKSRPAPGPAMAAREAIPTAVMDELAAAYGLGAVRAVEYRPEGRVNDNFVVDTDTGRYVVRRSNVKRGSESVRFEHRLVEHLLSHGFPAPVLVYTPVGASHHLCGDRVYRATRFMQGDPWVADEVGNVEEVARTLAHYHRVVRGFADGGAKAGFRPIVDELRDGAFLQATQAGPGLDVSTVATVKPPLRDVLERLDRALGAILARLEQPDGASLPRLVIHGSCRVASFIFVNGRVAAMLDYDNAYPDVRVLDVAIGILSFALVRPDKTSLDRRRALAFMRAYHHADPLTAEEQALLPWYMRARIVKRELMRYTNFVRRPTADREAKLERAVARLDWIDEHQHVLASVGGAPTLERCDLG